jgi:hypothetical protein
MGRQVRLNMPAIEASLKSVQDEFPRINAELDSKRDPLTDEVVANMMAGYDRIDDCLARGINLFRPGKSRQLLEINRVVLCGERVNGRKDANPGQSSNTEQHFYTAPGGGIGALMEWLELHYKDCIWKLAAGMFTRVLSQPQLYIEGNHRTGALLMSYVLAQRGQPPFVLTVENARHFFEPAALIKKRKKHGLDQLLRLPKLTKRFARLLEDQADGDFLLRR